MNDIPMDPLRTIFAKCDDAVKQGDLSVAIALRKLGEKTIKAYADEPMSVLAVVSTDSIVPRLEKFLATKEGWLNNVAENVWAAIRKGNDSLVWECDEKSEQATWYFTRAEGSVLSGGKYLFWYGIQDSSTVAQLIDEFNRGEQPQVLKHAPLASVATSLLGGNTPLKQVRAYSTLTPGRSAFSTRTIGKREYSTTAHQTTTNPNPPLRETTNEKPANIALIGARGYTGQALINLINAHPILTLSHVSSRELEGKPLEGYTKSQLIYENLQVEDVRRLEESGEIDCWVMALPNGVCKPFVDAVDAGSRPKQGKKTVIVDLSADYRFTDNWSYGLPGI
jgi:N-acetyl-gamma-glutamyl-phosphate reductase/acetylglutamate kinase